MMEAIMLTLKEELFIALHYNAKKSALVNLNPSTSELISFGGALVELMLVGRVRLDEHNLVVTDTSATKDDVLDEMLSQLAPTQPVKRANLDWILPIAKKAPVGHRVLAGLLKKGVLSRAEERTMFGLSHSVIYLPKAEVVQDITERERKVMLHQAKPDLQTATLLFMTSAWGGAAILGKLAGKEKKNYQQRWDALFSDYWGEYPVDHEMEPIEGLDPAIRKAIGAVAVSWATVQANYVVADQRMWRLILNAVDEVI
jgi:hypothetical protein